MKDRDRKDWGTPELARQFSVVPKLHGPNVYSGKVVDETEIDRLLLHDKITPSEHATLENFYARLQLAGFVSLRSPDLNSTVASDPSTAAERKALALRSVIQLFTRMDNYLGKHYRIPAVDLVMKDKPWPHGDDGLHVMIRWLQDFLSR